jgi:23S rRNA pseudouridine1911/1915/1917 synthase
MKDADPGSRTFARPPTAVGGHLHVRTTQPAAFIVARAEDGQTLQEFLATRMQVSKRRAKQAIDSRNVWVNRQRVWMAHHTVRPGDHVLAPADAAQPLAPPRIRILAEGPHYLFVDKPAGLVTVGEDSVEELLRVQQGQPDLRAVHRLDRDTSGCLMVARTQADFDAAVSQFKMRRVDKTYHAVVHGRIELRASTINADVDGERALTRMRLLQAREVASFIVLRIETGRTHQIRQHLASIRHPVLGDRQYGPKHEHDPRLLTVSRQMLHSSEIELPDPFGNEHLKAHSPLPADFRRVLKMLEL